MNRWMDEVWLFHLREYIFVVKTFCMKHIAMSFWYQSEDNDHSFLVAYLFLLPLANR